MSPPSLHILPMPQPQVGLPKISRKRKRQDGLAGDEMNDHHHSHAMSQNTEYSVVLTPDERAQRRLAGQDLKVSPPTHPFPHATPRVVNRNASKASLQRPVPSNRNDDPPQALRLRHLSTMLTLLHRLLEARDYPRATNALGLILRTEINGKFIDARHAGLWGIAAEVLLHHSASSGDAWQMRQGFEKSRLYYNKMALQHPWQRTWPFMTNAEDFKIALFGLWIQITCEQSQRLQPTHAHSVASDPTAHSEQALAAKRFEVAEAEKIVHEMDALMKTVPYIDNKHLIRLRANVALWYADLVQDVDELVSASMNESSLQEEDMDQVYIDSLRSQPN